MSEKINLSITQKKIVNHIDGAILVVASAGSGKTRVLTERIKYLIQNTKRKILAITFTNKAGEEMKERLNQLDDLNSRLFIGTFHGFCENVLQNHGQVIGLELMPHIFEDESDRLKLIEQAIEATPSYYSSYKKLSSKEQKDFRNRALNFISEVKRDLYTEEKLLEETNDDDLVLLFKSYQDILTSQNAIDFDDLILLTYKLFVEHSPVVEIYRRTYKYICVDEAQDLNYAQYQLLRALTGNDHKNVMMVGDPNQSIFGFNGSSSDYMTIDFVNDYEPRIIELKENYRSSKSVLRLAEKIIPDSNDIINTVKEGIVELYTANDEHDEAEFVIKKISELIKLKRHDDIEGEIIYEKIAILARNKYIFNTLESRLQEYKIPFYYKVTPGALQFESKVMQIFDMALRVKLNPQDILHWQRLCSLLNVKKNAKMDLKQLIVQSDLEENFKKIIEIVYDLEESGSNLKSKLEYYKEKLICDDENEKRDIYEDIKELLIHWYNYAKKVEVKSLHRFKNSMALGQTHPFSQPAGVTLSTVHTMKGQQYDIVFIIGADDETFPDYRAIRKGGVELIQEKNNLYVAITRSKRFLYITWPQKRLMPWGDYKFRRISRFLEKVKI